MEWNQDLLSQVSLLTRKHSFQWSVITKELKEYAARQQMHLSSVEEAGSRLDFITEQSVRTAFATQNEVRVPPPVTEKAAEQEGRRPGLQLDFDNMSVDEILAALEQEEERQMAKKEEIFRRVLLSLSPDEDPSSQLTASAAAVSDPATSAYFEAKKARLEQKKRAEIRRRETAEREKFEKEREELRRERESAEKARDHTSRTSTRAEEKDWKDYASGFPLSLLDSLSASLAPSLSALSLSSSSDPLSIDSSSLNLSTHLESFFGTQGDAFDAMLTEMEREIASERESEAGGKGEPLQPFIFL